MLLFLLEFFDSTHSVDEPHLAGKKWMTLRTNIYLNLFFGGSSSEDAAAVTGDYGVMIVFWMNGCFHSDEVIRSNLLS